MIHPDYDNDALAKAFAEVFREKVASAKSKTVDPTFFNALTGSRLKSLMDEEKAAREFADNIDAATPDNVGIIQRIRNYFNRSARQDAADKAHNQLVAAVKEEGDRVKGARMKAIGGAAGTVGLAGAGKLYLDKKRRDAQAASSYAPSSSSSSSW